MLRAKTRRGKKSRRKLEYAVIRDQIERRSAVFYKRLLRNLERVGECFVYKGARTADGYAGINFIYRGRHIKIHAHRVFLILQLGYPIPLGIDAGHKAGCGRRDCVLHVFPQPYYENAVTNGHGGCASEF